MPRIDPDLRIRAARGDDFDAVAALLEKLGRAKITEDTRDHCQALFRQQVVDPNAHHLVAENEGGEVVAFCSLQFRPRLNHVNEEAWVPDLIVSESSRRKGVAMALRARAS